MNDREYSAQKRRLEALRKKWLRTIGLGWWSIDIVYNRGDPEKASRDAPDGWTTAAVASVQWEYKAATITFNMRVVEGMSDAKLERVYVHELGHVLLNQMRAYRSDDGSSTEVRHEEFVATSLADALIWAWEAGRDAGLRARAKKRSAARAR